MTRIGLMALIAFWAIVPGLAAEDITLTTYYPSPRGIYSELRTTNDTLLATQGGSVLVGAPDISALPASNPKFYVMGAFESTSLRASESSGVALYLEGTPATDDGTADLGSYNYTTGAYARLHFEGKPIVMNRNPASVPAGSGGYVGIGSNSPGAKLHVRQTAVNDAGNPQTDPAFRVDTQSCEDTPFVIAANGNVGIGTDLPVAPLDIRTVAPDTRSTLLVLRGSADSNTTRMRIYNDNGGRYFSLVSTGAGSAFGQDKFVIADQGDLGTNDDARLTINSSGSVGIGTTSPNTKLHVNGGFTISDGSQANGRVLKSDDNGRGTWQPAYAVYAP